MAYYRPSVITALVVERDKDLILKRKRENRLKEEEKLAQATHIWSDEILPNWNHMYVSFFVFVSFLSVFVF